MSVNDAMAAYFRTADTFADLHVLRDPSAEPGYFRFGPDATCYGRSFARTGGGGGNGDLYDVSPDVRMDGTGCFLPFDPTEVIDNLRRERYVGGHQSAMGGANTRSFTRRAYYLARPFLSVSMRKYLQRISLRGWNQKSFPSWPVDRTVDNIFEKLLLLALQGRRQERIPFVWFWPEGKSGCMVMTHDVETQAGLEFCPSLMDLNESHGVKSSFQLIPEVRYKLPSHLVEDMQRRGFEVNVHDWNHDGHLFSDRDLFYERAAKINAFATQIGAEGFRSGALYRNIEWYDAFTVSYDMSVPNVAHLDPQRGGCCTTMPYFIGGLLEIPVTTTQDYSLFHILNDYSIDLWKRQIAIILKGNGLASFIVHPDYIIEQRARATYVELLKHLSQVSSEQNVWIVPPQQVNRWWRDRSQMHLVWKGDAWQIEGPGKDRARIAYANLDGDRLTYSLN